ncbi:hypothetical protein LCGC14_1832800, partial [marine sediment metagenome]
IRVPRPATGNTAFKTFTLIPFIILLTAKKGITKAESLLSASQAL